MKGCEVIVDFKHGQDEVPAVEPPLGTVVCLWDCPSIFWAGPLFHPLWLSTPLAVRLYLGVFFAPEFQ